MKELYLVRHAKSSWAYDDVDDYDRPLKGRGISDAHFISNILAQQNTTPQALFSSPATRAVHTAMIFARNLNFPFSAIRLHEDLYMCSEGHLLEFIRSIDNDYKSVLIFGHNPTLTNFVNRCTPQRIDNLPTTGVACFHFDINNWNEAQFSAELALLDYPKKHRKKS